MIGEKTELTAGFGRDIRTPVQNRMTNALVKSGIRILEILPDFSTFALVIIRFFKTKEDGADAHHHGKVILHVFLELSRLDIVGKIDGIDHQASDAQLLITTRVHDLFVNALVFAANEITVHVLVEIANGFNIRKRYVYEDVIHIEGVFGKL